MTSHDDQKPDKIPAWPETRTTTLDTPGGKRIWVETIALGNLFSFTRHLSELQITSAKFDLLAQIKRECIEELTREITGRYPDLPPDDEQ